MELSKYLQNTTQSKFADMLGVTQGMVHQWANGLRPVSAEKCVIIENLTHGNVTRRDLRPDDWHLIWPELAEKAAA